MGIIVDIACERTGVAVHTYAREVSMKRMNLEEIYYQPREGRAISVQPLIAWEFLVKNILVVEDALYFVRPRDLVRLSIEKIIFYYYQNIMYEMPVNEIIKIEQTQNIADREHMMHCIGNMHVSSITYHSDGSAHEWLVDVALIAKDFFTHKTPKHSEKTERWMERWARR